MKWDVVTGKYYNEPEIRGCDVVYDLPLCSCVRYLVIIAHLPGGERIMVFFLSNFFVFFLTFYRKLFYFMCVYMDVCVACESWTQWIWKGIQSVIILIFAILISNFQLGYFLRSMKFAWKIRICNEIGAVESRQKLLQLQEKQIKRYEQNINFCKQCKMQCIKNINLILNWHGYDVGINDNWDFYQ